MKLYKVEAIVSRHYSLGESDKIIVLLTKKQGRIRAVAKGSKKIKSKLSGGIQVLTRSNYLIYKGKNLDIVRQCEIIDSFRNIKNDLSRTAWGMFIVELSEEFFSEGEDTSLLYNLLLKTLECLKDWKNHTTLGLAFILKLLKITGYLPEFYSCSNCGKIDLKDIYFSVESGGIVCSDCKNNNNEIYLDSGLLKLLKVLLEWNMDSLKVLKISDNRVKTLENILYSFIQFHIDKTPKSLKFLKTLEGR